MFPHLILLRCRGLQTHCFLLAQKTPADFSPPQCNSQDMGRWCNLWCVPPETRRVLPRTPSRCSLCLGAVSGTCRLCNRPTKEWDGSASFPQLAQLWMHLSLSLHPWQLWHSKYVSNFPYSLMQPCSNVPACELESSRLGREFWPMLSFPSMTIPLKRQTHFQPCLRLLNSDIVTEVAVGVIL